jgi:hypothetical protein
MEAGKKSLILFIVFFLAATVTPALAQQAAEASLEGAEAFIGEDLLPPSAEPGECYTRVFVPPTYKYVTEDILKSEASERIEIIAAQYEWVEDRVMVRGPSERLEKVPAQYEWIEEEVLVKDAGTRLEEVPAVYETVSEKVLERPAHTVWKKGRGLVERVNGTTGEILCLVEVPAKYKTVYKRVLVKPITTREIPIPEAYKTVKRKVMTSPPTVRKIEIQAEYETIKVKKLIKPAEVKRIPIPAKFQTVSRKVQVTEGKMEWRRVLCQTNMDPQTIASVQKALKKAGFDPGPIDGIIGKLTMEAVRSFQKEKGLAIGNLTYETLNSLGVRIKSAASS